MVVSKCGVVWWRYDSSVLRALQII
ncbi:hypothetical protein M8C21_017544 [Ambrosia artemisiifolia]|uniref:Uncharacterized protein n=1 Tax=Ambrosia artemisiifolia TaxID=4212 RepID=A0AAD5GAG3_AMBAR|nr:hypothetical protein M8C21_017544 [Ambrosia artemisiifolia]